MRFDLPWQLQSASARATYIRWTMDVRQSTEIKYVVSRKDQWTCISRQPSTWRPFFFQTLCLQSCQLAPLPGYVRDLLAAPTLPSAMD